MPAFLTHWRVLIETAQRSQDAGNDLGSLIIDNSALHRRSAGGLTPSQNNPAGAVWITGPLPKIDIRFPGSDISAMAFLGALAPDMTYFQKGSFREKISDFREQNRHKLQSTTASERRWADLLHYNRSGDVLLAFLELTANIPSPALRSQALAFAMGYLSHIAADIALNPYINTLVGIYSTSEVPGKFAPLGTHFYIEFCLDEYIANTFFNQPLYRWIRQPWGQYIEPAAANCITPATLSAQVLHLLNDSIGVTYELTEEQSQVFEQDYRAGLRRLRMYLAGRGTFRLFTFKALTRKRVNNPIIARLAENSREPGTLNYEQVMAYAVRLSEHLCRRAIGYYAALRNTSASASERNQKLSALCEDLRNWNLDSGYTKVTTRDEEPRMVHNWDHFASLWENEDRPMTPAQELGS